MAYRQKSKNIKAFKDMILTNISFIDDHINWIRNNDVKHAASGQIQRQMLNHLMILHEAFNRIPKLFGKKYEYTHEEKLMLYKKIYLLGRYRNDIPKCTNDNCDMEQELLLFIPEPELLDEIKSHDDEILDRYIEKAIDALLEQEEIPVSE